MPIEDERLPTGIESVGKISLVGFAEERGMDVEMLAIGRVSEGSPKLDVGIGTTIEREILADGRTILVGIIDGNTSVTLTDGTTTEREMLIVGSTRLVGAIIGMTIELEILTGGRAMLVGTKDGNTSVALTDGATTEREILIVGSTRLVGTRDGTTIDEMFNVGTELEIEIGGSGVNEGSTMTVEMLSDGAPVGSAIDGVGIPGTEMFSEGTGSDNEAVGQGKADEGSKNGMVMLGTGARDGSGRVDKPPVGKGGRVGTTETAVDAERVG
jgi:hypothetical protein